MHINNKRRQGLVTWCLVALASTLVAACGGGGGRDPILGSGVATLGPTVVSVTPTNASVGVTILNPVISATFSEPVSALAADGFVLRCAAPCVNPTGSLSLDSTNKTATFSLTAGTTLTPSTLYTATVSNARSLANGSAMPGPYTWSFTTGIADVVPPRVTATTPVTTSPGPTPNVPASTAVSAVFNKAMQGASITPANFRVVCSAPCVSPTGVVSYDSNSMTASYIPGAPLSAGVRYTATISSAVTDLSGNRLAGNQAAFPSPSDYIWTFVIAGTAAPANVTVSSTNPSANANNVCPAANINATFLVPYGLRMDGTSVNAATFTVTGPAATPVVASSIVLDAATGTIASFKPAVALTPGVTYTAKLQGGPTGVKDLAAPANTMLSDVTWSFTAGPATGICLMTPVPLNSVATFGTFGGSAGMTNQGLLSIINGDIGTTAVSTAVTGFHDTGPGCTYTETPLNNGPVNGKIYTAAPPPTVGCPSEGTASTFLIASNARADALAAYNALVAMPAGSDPGAGSLSGLTLAPGVYTSASGSFKIQGKDLTLDAQGDPNAVFVFQMATTLTVGGPGAAFPQSVILINGAQAKNVYWQVGSAATINAGGGGTMVGTIIAQSGAAFSTAGNVAIVTLNGRALSLGASVTLVNTVINVPAP